MPSDEPQPEQGARTDKGGPELIRPQKPSFVASLRSSFLAGIVVIAPIGITVALIYWFVSGPMSQLDTFVKRFIPAGDSMIESLTRAIPGFGVLIAVVFIILLGALAKNFIGRALIKTGENLVESMPIVRNLYRFFKNVFETALQQSERSFKEVALVEYPRPGLWVMAFVIGETKGEVRHVLADTGEQLTSVFVPTVPNPTSGFLLFLPRSALRPLTMTVEDAAKVVLSLGLVAPQFTHPGDAVRELQSLAEATLGKDQRKARLGFLKKG